MEEFKKEDYIGNWKNFELYFTDTNPIMVQAWCDAENAIKTKKKNLIEKILYRKGAKQFWIDYCYTITKENKVQLGGLMISPSIRSDLSIEWFNKDQKIIAKHNYTLDTIVEEGLEKKVNYLLKSDTSIDNPFHYVLLMPPMPERDAKNNGGLISHFHFQFSNKKENILKSDNKLKQPHWYATMCDGDCRIEQERDIVLALHGIKKEL